MSAMLKESLFEELAWETSRCCSGRTQCHSYRWTLWGHTLCGQHTLAEADGVVALLQLRCVGQQLANFRYLKRALTLLEQTCTDGLY